MTRLPYQIDVDLDVFKALTAKNQAEGLVHNDVLRDILNLDSPVEAELPDTPLSVMSDAISRSMYAGQFYSRGLALPNGTELRARYKGQQYSAQILDGKWFSLDGLEFTSPSAAASAITGTTVNGWRFWEAKRPGDRGWRRLDILNAK